MPLEQIMKFGSKSNDQVRVSLKVTKLEKLGKTGKPTEQLRFAGSKSVNGFRFRTFSFQTDFSWFSYQNYIKTISSM
jgi:hypothetical protein